MPYTYETFRDYLELDILQSTADLMGWKDSPAPHFVAEGNAFYPTSLFGPKSAQGVYDAITNEVLLALGYSTPETVPDEALLEMRSLGRVEAWRAVALNSMADTDVNMGDSVLNRRQLFANALNQLELAELEHSSKFGAESAPPISRPRATTYTGSVAVRW